MKKLILVFVNILMAGLLFAEPQPGDADYPQASPSVRHRRKVKAVRTGNYDLALIGDSITHVLDKFGGKYAPLSAVWQKHYAPRHAINLGYSGYRTEQILWNLQNGELDFKTPPKVVMLLIGTNNADDRHFEKVHTAKEIFDGTKAIVNLIRERLPTTKILVLRIFPRGGDDQKGVSPPIFHSSKKCIQTCFDAGEMTAKLADGEHVFWQDINYVFLRPDGTINTDLLWDLLHPSPAGAEAWAQAVEPTLAKLMGDRQIVDQRPVSVVPSSRRDGSYDWMGRHRAVLAAHSTNPTIVFLGDSITHHMGGVPAPTGPFNSHKGSEFWKTVCGAAGGTGLNMGFGSDWTQHLLWRIDHGELDGISPHYAVLMIGANNVLRGNRNPDDVVAGIRACILRIRAKVPDAKLILMGVLPCRNPASNPLRQEVIAINGQLKKLAIEAKCDFLDIGSKFLDNKGEIPQALMHDGIHPTAAGYKIWSNALVPLLVQ
jgi:lysophospholipase L1-like esterase